MLVAALELCECDPVELAFGKIGVHYNLLCRLVRLGTASILTQAGGPFINVNRLDLAKYAARPHLSRVLCDYMLYFEHNTKKAMELCNHALKQPGKEAPHHLHRIPQISNYQL